MIVRAPTCREGLSFLLANSGRIFDIRGGWAPIVAAAIEQILAIEPEVQIRQIKQKIGGLRIYYRSEHYEELRAIVQEAELLCEKTCEECGKRGEPVHTRRGWIRALCEEHRGDSESTG